MNHRPIEHALHRQPAQTIPGSSHPKRQQRRHQHRKQIGARADRIEGSFRRITVHQLTLAWWLYANGHITRRQYRVYFAAHELAERRRYTSEEHKGSKPLYTTREIARLVLGTGGFGLGGGGHDERALASLRSDLRTLDRIGLVSVTKHAITFAASAEQINAGSGGVNRSRGGEGEHLVDELAGFWRMFSAMPNSRRSVPVPRRLLRAMAAGFSKGVAALVSAILIRGLYWHKESSDYRTDGRYKLSWIAEHFGISRRAATDARKTLIDLGWLEPLEVRQWEMNRWGLRDRIVPEWSHTGDTVNTDISQSELADPKATIRVASADPDRDTGSATPRHENHTGSASPNLNQNTLPTEDLRTRKLAGTPPNPDGVSARNDLEECPRSARRSLLNKPGSRGGRHHRRPRRNSGRASSTKPNIRDIQLTHLQETPDLLELYRQAITIGLASPSEAGRLDFLALAERAKAHGTRAGALFYWLLREKKSAFITQREEDAAARRLRSLHDPVGTQCSPRERRVGCEGVGGSPDPGAQPHQVSPPTIEYSRDELFVIACMRVAQQHRIGDAFRIAHAEGWTRDRWDNAVERHEATAFAIRQAQLMEGVED